MGDNQARVYKRDPRHDQHSESIEAKALVLKVAFVVTCRLNLVIFQRKKFLAYLEHFQKSVSYLR
jgi:hypothetical protein